MYPYNLVKSKGLLGLVKGVNFSGFLDGAQKTLGVINQAIPVFYQVKPMISNARTMFKIADIVKTPDVSNNSGFNSNSNFNNFSSSNNSSEGPIFYI